MRIVIAAPLILLVAASGLEAQRTRAPSAHLGELAQPDSAMRSGSTPTLGGVSVGVTTLTGDLFHRDFTAWFTIGRFVVALHTGSMGVTRVTDTLTFMDSPYQVVTDSGSRTEGLLVGPMWRRGKLLAWLAAGPARIAPMISVLGANPIGPTTGIIDFGPGPVLGDAEVGALLTAKATVAITPIVGLSGGLSYARSASFSGSNAWIGFDVGRLMLRR